MKLKQIQYRSYMHEITIYHFQEYHISLHNFRSLLNRQHGYVDTLVSFDPLISMPGPEGDEVPEGCIEVGYLPSVFQHGGSALGFRVENNMVEWMCFDRPINEMILNTLDVRDLCPGVKLMLFDRVASLDKGISERRVRGATPEHKAWHKSLWKAEHRRVRVGLTWKHFGTELQKQHALQRLEHAKSELGVTNNGFANEMSETDEDVDEDEDADQKGVDNYGVFTSLGGEHVEEEHYRRLIDQEEEETITETLMRQSIYEDKRGDGDEQTDNMPSK